jgi:acetoin utilization protein AcuC
VRAFRPQVLVSQHGCDTHAHDPLAHFCPDPWTPSATRPRVDAPTWRTRSATAWVALGGGGYEVVDVVPRSWTHLTAIAAHRPVPVERLVPQEWLDHVEATLRSPGSGADG